MPENQLAPLSVVRQTPPLVPMEVEYTANVALLEWKNRFAKLVPLLVGSPVFAKTQLAPKSVEVYTPLWVEGMVAGKGWIALALTTFATWRPARVLLGAYLFGGVTMLQFHLQGVGVEVPSQFLGMMPYLATIVVLALISRNPAWIRVNMPASLGKPFHPGS